MYQWAFYPRSISLLRLNSQEEVEKYSEDLKELQNVRETATQIDRPSDAGRNALLRYAAQLEALESVFPVSETEVCWGSRGRGRGGGVPRR